MAGAPLPDLTEEELARYNQIKTQRQAKAPPPMGGEEFEQWYYQNVANPSQRTEYEQGQWDQFQQTPVGQMAPERGLSGGNFPGFMPTTRQAAGQPSYGYTPPKSPNYIAIYLDGAGKAIRAGTGGQGGAGANMPYTMIDSAYMMSKGFVDDRGNLTPEGEDWVAQQVFWPYAVYRGAEDFVTYSDQAANSDNWNDWFWNSVAAAGGFLGMYPGGSNRMQFRPRPMKTGYPAVGKRRPGSNEPEGSTTVRRIDPNTGEPFPDIQEKPVFYSPANRLLTDPQSPLAKFGDKPLTYEQWVGRLAQQGVTKEELRWMTNEMRKRYGADFDPKKTPLTRQQMAEVQYSSIPNLEVRAMPPDQRYGQPADARKVPLALSGEGNYPGGFEYKEIKPTETAPGVPPRSYRIVTNPNQPNVTEIQISTDGGKTWKHGWGYGGHGAPPAAHPNMILQDITRDTHKWNAQHYGGTRQRKDGSRRWQDTQGGDHVVDPPGDRRSNRDGFVYSGRFSENPTVDNFQTLQIGLLDDQGNPIDLPQGHATDNNAIVFAPTIDAVDEVTGGRVLRVMEIQSDAEQQGRQVGYGQGRYPMETDPRMPYQSSYEYTKAMVRAILSHAARNGYDSVQFPSADEVITRWPSGGEGVRRMYGEYLPRAIDEVSKELGIPPQVVQSRPVSHGRNPETGQPYDRHNTPHRNPDTEQRFRRYPTTLLGRVLNDLALGRSDRIDAQAHIQDIRRRIAQGQVTNVQEAQMEIAIIERLLQDHQGSRLPWDEFVMNASNAYLKGRPEPTRGIRLDPRLRKRIVEDGLRISRMDPEQSGEEPTSAYG